MKTNNSKPTCPIPSDPDDFDTTMREIEIEAINDTAGLRERAWRSYFQTLAELGMDTDDY